ncbi:MAG TPA: hypothetical protein VNZ61_16595 [Roseomonas sp.]|nr:hypothetical protein [Roseomonas sp.]
MPPIPEDIREHYEAVDAALSDIGHVVTLLDLVLEQVMEDQCCTAQALGFFLSRQLDDLRRKAEANLDGIWVACGGNPEGGRQP